MATPSPMPVEERRSRSSSTSVSFSAGTPLTRLASASQSSDIAPGLSLAAKPSMTESGDRNSMIFMPGSDYLG